MISETFGKIIMIKGTVGQLSHFTRHSFACLWWQGLGQRLRHVNISAAQDIMMEEQVPQRQQLKV